MRCYICDRVIEDPSWNHQHEDFDPCPTCQIEINELLISWDEDDEEVMWYLEEDEDACDFLLDNDG